MSEIKVVPCPHEFIYWVDEKGRKFHHEKCPANGTAARSVETRPPATLQCNVRAETLAAVEQAAPPRPLDAETELMQALADFVMGYQIDSPTDSHHRSWNEGVAVAASQFLDPQDNRPVIEALKKYTAAPAAIEQARPQMPDHPYSAKHPQAGICSQCGEAESHESHAAAAEPAPERTPPTRNDAIEEVTVLLKKIVAEIAFTDPPVPIIKEFAIQLFKTTIEKVESLKSARAVAVPEPAAAPPTLYCDVCDTELQRESCDRVRPCAKCLKAEPAAQQESGKTLEDLLAVIHRDGGHYTGEHGLQKSFDDAVAKVLPFLQAEPAPTPSRAEIIRPPFQKALTVICQPDESRALADADVASIQSGSSTVFRMGMPELYFHQLRLRVQENPELNKKIAVFYLKHGVMHPLGLTKAEELNWPAGAFQEGWETEVAIGKLRRAEASSLGTKERDENL